MRPFPPILPILPFPPILPILPFPPILPIPPALRVPQEKSASLSRLRV
jgi:hypothetical protein